MKEIRDRKDDLVLSWRNGSQSAMKNTENLDLITSTSLLDVDEVPEHLLVLGGNYVGLEFAQMFHRFGSKISVLERGPKIVAREDKDIAETLTKILLNEALGAYTNAEAIKFERQHGKIKATVIVDGIPQEISFLLTRPIQNH